MTKIEYLNLLRDALSKVTNNYLDNRIDYYSEMIDDRIEEGMSEEEAVASMESIESIVEATKLEKPLPTLVAEKVKEKNEELKKSDNKALIIVLLILASPVWLPIACVVAALGIALLACAFSVVITIFAVLIGIIAMGIGCLISPFFMLGNNTALSAPLVISCIGSSLFLIGVGGLLVNPAIRLFKMIMNGFKKLITSIKKKL